MNLSFLLMLTESLEMELMLLSYKIFENSVFKLFVKIKFCDGSQHDLKGGI